MEEIGRVVAVEGDSVVVSVKRSPTCGKHERCSHCSSDEITSTALNMCSAAVGDRVELDYRPGALGKTALLLYGIPLAAMVLGFALGSLFFFFFFAFITGIASLCACFAVLRLLEKRLNNARKFTPVAVRIASHEEEALAEQN
jgi:positive regulator of sigma E activity